MNLAIQQKWLKFKHMKFVEIINKKKFTLISIFLFIFVLTNLLDGMNGIGSVLFRHFRHIFFITFGKKRLEIDLITISQTNHKAL